MSKFPKPPKCNQLYYRISQLTSLLTVNEIKKLFDLDEQDWKDYLILDECKNYYTKKRVKELAGDIKLERKIYGFKHKKGAKYPETDFFAQDVIKKFGSEAKCYLTGKKVNVESGGGFCFDHIVPPCRGGTNELNNLMICDNEMNRIKFDHSLPYLFNLFKKVLENNGYEVKQVKDVLKEMNYSCVGEDKW